MMAKNAGFAKFMQDKVLECKTILQNQEQLNDILLACNMHVTCLLFACFQYNISFTALGYSIPVNRYTPPQRTNLPSKKANY